MAKKQSIITPAEQLRRAMRELEKTKYEDLLYRQIVAGSDLPDPVRQFRFHPDRRYRCDFAWPNHKLIVEIEGQIWNNGRHTRGSGFLKDCQKYNEAELMGYHVLRYPPELVEDMTALKQIIEFIGRAGPA
jgi:very-short-patch-repair endonuclease